LETTFSIGRDVVVILDPPSEDANVGEIDVLIAHTVGHQILRDLATIIIYGVEHQPRYYVGALSITTETLG
jgi:hypothetical protein